MTEKVIDTIKTVIGLIAVAFAVFFFLDDRHAHYEDLEGADADLRERILMSESTRYAEVAKYYSDRMAEGKELSEAEKDRLELVQRQQQRIHDTLKKE